MSEFVLLSEKRDGVFAAMRECGKLMRAAHDMETTDGAITDKAGSANFVTVYDLKVQEKLIWALAELFPTAGFFAEEKENPPELLEQGLCFIIDPIDGTTNFIHGLHCSAISVALYEKKQPLFGAVYDPYMDEMFWAVRGQGAFLNDRPIRVAYRPLEKALVAFGSSPYNRLELGNTFFQKLYAVFLATADIRRGGSAALDLCNVAAGRTDVFFEEVLSPWDYAAGILILSEAGATVTDLRGQPLKIGEKSSVLTANAVLHHKMLGLLS